MPLYIAQSGDFGEVLRCSIRPIVNIIPEDEEDDDDDDEEEEVVKIVSN